MYKPKTTISAVLTSPKGSFEKVAVWKILAGKGCNSTPEKYHQILQVANHYYILPVPLVTLGIRSIFTVKLVIPL